ncbi:MAG: virulence factor Mce family protein [Acidobacteria bacterium]|nr:virulence factor Mce family protein [Acidobacteriota bacterium]
MPRTRSLAFSQLKIGVLAAAAIAIAATVIFVLNGEGGFFWQRYPLKTRFSDVAGLKTGAPVRVAGMEVGTVRSIEFAGDQVEVAFDVSKEMRSRITTESVAALGSLSLLGQATVDVSPSTEGKPLPDWAYVRSGRLPGQLTDVAAEASDALAETARLVKTVRAGKGTIGRLFTDDRLFTEIQGFVHAAEQVAENLRQGRGTMGKLASDPSVYQSLDASLDSLNAILARVNAGEGSLGQLVNDERLARSLGGAAGNLEAVSGKLARGEGTAGRLLHDEALYTRLSATAERLEQLTTRLSEGQGTAGQLLQDRQLYENMNGAASELRGLIAAIKQDPRKYLTVKVSVF